MCNFNKSKNDRTTNPKPESGGEPKSKTLLYFRFFKRFNLDLAKKNKYKLNNILLGVFKKIFIKVKACIFNTNV